MTRPARARAHLAGLALVCAIGAAACGRGSLGADAVADEETGTADGPGEAALLAARCPGLDFQEVDVQVPYSVSGTNGTFADQCSMDGNLSKHYCEREKKQICDEEGCRTVLGDPTGAVAEEMVDCGGTCSQGRCAPRCPAWGDVIEYRGEMPPGIFEAANVTLGVTCRCSFRSSGCAGLSPGQRAEAPNTGRPRDRTCAGGDRFELRFWVPGECNLADCAVP